MPDLEKVIEGLKELRSHFCAMAGIASSRQGRANHIESKRIIEDAIELIKAQEAHIVTESDFNDADDNGYIPAWCEVLERDGTIVELGYTTIRREALNRVSFNRFWTSRPTDTQREAVKWE